MIRLQTALRRDIPNLQLVEISAFERNWAADLPLSYKTVIFRTGLCPRYNCHGLAFASRRTRIPDGESVKAIRNDDGYVEVERHKALPGDVVVYYGQDGDASHSGIVVANEGPLYIPLIVSKWGSGPEVIHSLYDVPPLYGRNTVFLRCSPS